MQYSCTLKKINIAGGERLQNAQKSTKSAKQGRAWLLSELFNVQIYFGYRIAFVGGKELT